MSGLTPLAALALVARSLILARNVERRRKLERNRRRGSRYSASVTRTRQEIRSAGR
jgi:hypothetical protein